jgi:hypothetical protein
LYERKSCQIATDNALIHLGQRDQRLWQRIIEEQNRLEQLHAAHHAVHACARVPGTSAKCLPLDRKEPNLVLERMHWQLKLRARSRLVRGMPIWHMGNSLGWGSLQENGEGLSPFP